MIILLFERYVYFISNSYNNYITIPLHCKKIHKLTQSFENNKYEHKYSRITECIFNRKVYSEPSLY